MIAHMLSFVAVKLLLLLVRGLGQKGVRSLIPLLSLLLKPYRKKVIQANLNKCFPELPLAEKKALHQKYLGYLCEVLLQSLLGFVSTPKRLAHWQKFTAHNLLDQMANQSTNCFVVMGHTSNWEWAGLRAGMQQGLHMAAVYKPQSNTKIDRFLKITRRRFGTEMVAMSEVPRFLAKKESPWCLTFIADQNPPKETAHWVDFFGTKTAFFSGWSRLAVRMKVPVLLAVPKDSGPWNRCMDFSLIYNGTEALPPEELTARFAHALEAQIRARPEAWLWSHKRWKHVYTP